MQEEWLARCTENQFIEAFNEIYKKLTEGKNPVNSPLGTVLGGQPGAGKSTIHKIVGQREPNTISIVGDDFREQHPNFAVLNEKYSDSVPYTASFSGKMTEALITRLSDERYNLVIEGTLRTADVPEKTATLLNRKGYTTQLYVMAVSAEQSWQGTLSRFDWMKEKGITPRATDKGHHDMVVAALPDNLRTLYDRGSFDQICLYTREKECIYDSKKTPDINPGEIIKPILDGKSINEKMKNLGKENSTPFRTLADYKQLIQAERNPSAVNSTIRAGPEKNTKSER
jgi:UDP-N-acetylglucosamine kinase